jgi:hypothetical protein
MVSFIRSGAGTGIQKGQKMQSVKSAGLAGDIIEGAEAIALLLWGDVKKKRRVYHLAETGELPIFRLGSIIHARKSVLLAHIEQQERAALNSAKAS